MFEPNSSLSRPPFRWLVRLLKASLALVLLVIGGLILNGFPNYFPPRFDQGFLLLRDAYFFRHGYAVGFYLHILAAPVVLLCGIPQFSATLRRRFPLTHERIGLVYVWAALLAAAPGGLWMAFYAYGGWPGKMSFALVSLLLWAFTFVAWRCARVKNYRQHGRWMIRSYLMISSAVSLRLIHYALTEWGVGRLAAYQWSAWLSWLPTLALCELVLLASWFFQRKKSPAT